MKTATQKKRLTKGDCTRQMSVIYFQLSTRISGYYNGLDIHGLFQVSDDCSRTATAAALLVAKHIQTNPSQFAELFKILWIYLWRYMVMWAPESFESDGDVFAFRRDIPERLRSGLVSCATEDDFMSLVTKTWSHEDIVDVLFASFRQVDGDKARTVECAVRAEAIFFLAARQQWAMNGLWWQMRL